jgi:hypothetical protein
MGWSPRLRLRDLILGTVILGIEAFAVDALSVMGSGPPCRPAPRAAGGVVTECPQCTVSPVAPIGGKPDETCANCGGPADGSEEVHRVYVTIDPSGRVTASETMEPVEWWCLSCRSLYPHESHPAGD